MSRTFIDQVSQFIFQSISFTDISFFNYIYTKGCHYIFSLCYYHCYCCCQPCTIIATFVSIADAVCCHYYSIIAIIDAIQLLPLLMPLTIDACILPLLTITHYWCLLYVLPLLCIAHLLLLPTYLLLSLSASPPRPVCHPSSSCFPACQPTVFFNTIISENCWDFSWPKHGLGFPGDHLQIIPRSSQVVLVRSSWCQPHRSSPGHPR